MKTLAWSGTIEPLAPGWASLTLLARAAAYAKHRENYSALFRIDTMEPLIAGPPFVRTLNELVAASRTVSGDPLAYDPAAARAAFWRGQCGMAIAWPSAADERSKKTEPKAPASIRVGFAELPGSQRVFNLESGAWDDRSDEDDTRVPLLAVAGRLGMVAQKASDADAAFHLLVWLSDDRISPQVCPESPATTLFRQSQVQSPKAWVERQVPATAAAHYADVTREALQREAWLGALRIPGREEYLAALDEAVASAVRSKSKEPAHDALLKAETKWRKITERLGLERQRVAYRRSLGLD
jgi:multiple sugar transport system substrate-binding protein